MRAQQPKCLQRDVGDALEHLLHEIIGATPQGLIDCHVDPLDAFDVTLINISYLLFYLRDLEIAKRNEINSLLQKNLWHKVNRPTLAQNIKVLNCKSISVLEDVAVIQWYLTQREDNETVLRVENDVEIEN